MRSCFTVLLIALLPMIAMAQVDINKSIRLTGSGSDARIQGIDTVAASDDAVDAATLQSGRLSFQIGTGSGNPYLVSLTPAVSSVTPGMVVHFQVPQQNNGAAGLMVNGIGPYSVKKNFNQDLDSADLDSGQIVMVIFDGTNWQVLNQLNSSSGSSGGSFSFGNTKRIFITDSTYNGNLGGVSGADAKCQARANAAGLTGTWKALISTSSLDVRNRSNSTAIYVNMIGDIVAFGYKDLFLSRPNVDNNVTVIMNTVGFNEFGNQQNGNFWNGSNEAGEGGLSNCNNWTNQTSQSGGHIGDGMRLISTSFWGGNGNNQNCNTQQRLACYEE